MKKQPKDNTINKPLYIFQKYIKGIKIVVEAVSQEEAEKIFNSYKK
jgi:hypothetical protein